MGIIAWIALGMAAALLANMLLPGKRSRGLIFICLACFTAALGAKIINGELGSLLAREQAVAGPLARPAAANGTAVS